MFLKKEKKEMSEDLKKIKEAVSEPKSEQEVCNHKMLVCWNCAEKFSIDGITKIITDNNNKMVDYFQQLMNYHNTHCAEQNSCDCDIEKKVEGLRK